MFYLDGAKMKLKSVSLKSIKNSVNTAVGRNRSSTDVSLAGIEAALGDRKGEETVRKCGQVIKRIKSATNIYELQAQSKCQGKVRANSLPEKDDVTKNRFPLTSPLSRRNKRKCPKTNVISEVQSVATPLLSRLSFRSPFIVLKENHKPEETKRCFQEMLNCIRTDDCKRLKAMTKKNFIGMSLLNLETTLIHEATYKGCVRCIKTLIKTGSCIDSKDSSGWSSTSCCRTCKRG